MIARQRFGLAGGAKPFRDTSHRHFGKIVADRDIDRLVGDRIGEGADIIAERARKIGDTDGGFGHIDSPERLLYAIAYLR